MPLIAFIDKVTMAKDQNEYSIGVFLDLMKAFDTINHRILLKKLEHYGIRGLALKLLTNYLTGRTQCVTMNGSLSDYLPLKNGVPQGSILGPLLFLIYINDLANLSPLIDLFLFADDANALFVSKNIATLINIVNSELSKMDLWFKTNKLSLNVQKTKYMLFTPHTKELPHFDIVVNNNNIERVNHITFLGVEIDEKLTWNKHVEKITIKLSSAIGILYKIRSKLTVKSALMIYEALIGTHINYCNIIWGCGYKSSLNRLFILQKRALRLCLKLPKKTNSLSLFKTANKLKVYEINHLQTALFVHLVAYKNSPTLFQNFFLPTSTFNIHSSRRKLNMQTKYAKSNIRKFSLSVRGPTIWNNIPDLFKEIFPNHRFKKSFRRYIISKRTEETINEIG